MYRIEKSEAKRFEFEIDGKEYSVPRRESLPFPKFREIQKRIKDADDPAEEGVNAIFDLFDEFAPGALDSLDFEQALNLINAYSTGDEGETLGESSTSSD